MNKIIPPKPVKEMTLAEINSFRNSLDADSMGFTDKEGVVNDNQTEADFS